VKIRAMIDTGCTAYIITLRVLQRMGLTVSDLRSAPPVVVVGETKEGLAQTAPCLGSTMMAISTARTSTLDRVYVIEDPSIEMLLPRKFSNLSEILRDFIRKENTPVESPPRVAAASIKELGTSAATVRNTARVQQQCEPLKDSNIARRLLGLGTFSRTPIQVDERISIVLKPNTPADVMWTHQYPQVAAARETREEEAQHLHKLGILERVAASEARFCSPQFILPGGRVVTDMSRLSKYIVREHMEFPSMKSLQAVVENNKFFTVFDFRKWFYQIPLSEDSRDVTTFRTSSGFWRYTRLVMGLSISPREAQRLLEKVFQRAGLTPSEGFGYMDDGLLGSPTLAEHKDKLLRLLESFEHFKVCINVDKLQIAQSHVKFCGYIPAENRVIVDPEKVKAIEDWALPVTLVALRRFVGTLNYVRQHFRVNLSAEAKPMTELLSTKDNGARIQWKLLHRNVNYVKAFERVKAGLKRNIANHAPTLNGELWLATDASDHALGAVLYDRTLSGDWNVVSVASQVLRRTYTFSEIDEAKGEITADRCPLARELAAIVFGLRQFSFYTQSRQVHVQTDHLPLLGMFKNRLGVQAHTRITQVLTRTLLAQLLEHNVALHYIKGEENAFADVLSRDVPDGTVPQALQPEWSEERQQAEKPSALRVAIPFATDKLTARDATALHRLQEEGKLFMGDNFALVRVNGKLKVYVTDTEVQKVLEWAHGRSHRGEKAMRAELQSYWWPSKSKEIKGYKWTCSCWQADNAIQPVLLRFKFTAEEPRRVFQADIMFWAQRKFLVTVDIFSSFPEVIEIKENTSEAIVDAFKATLLSRYGFITITTDNEALLNLARERHHGSFRVGATRHSPSAGKVERLIQTIRTLTKRAGVDPITASIMLRTEEMIGIHNSRPLSKAGIEFMEAKIKEHRENLARIKAHTPKFSPGDLVVVYHKSHHKDEAGWSGPCRVVSLSDNKTSYHILTPKGMRGLQRSRVHPDDLRRFAPPSDSRPRFLPWVLESWQAEGHDIKECNDPEYAELQFVIPHLIATTRPGDCMALCHPVWRAAIWFEQLNKFFTTIQAYSLAREPLYEDTQLEFTTTMAIYRRRLELSTRK
jgi:hypothetical protein